MTYNELKRIAQPHIRENDVLPSNSFLLLVQLHIVFKNEKQCEEDYGGKMNPLYNSPAFLLIKSKTKTLYFNSTSKYWNFYVFHEIAHYILGHENDSAQNELDADLLACCLAAPTENLPTTLKTARDLSTLCQIPIDKAEVYWNEIKDNFVTSRKKTWITLSLSSILLISLMVFGNNYISQDSNNINVVASQTQIEQSPVVESNIDSQTDAGYYITSSGTHYHTVDCQYIKSKTNTIKISVEDIEKLNLEACKKCIN